MDYHFRNLVFEGGGVKGIAYLGALEVLEERKIMANIKRVGGTSVGAINAALLALGYTLAEQKKILWELNFEQFQDADKFFFGNISRLWKNYGWNKGDFCRAWLGKLVSDKTGNPRATFGDLRQRGLPDLYVYGTNLSTRFGEVFSPEHTPDMSIVEGVRISMSFPVYFAAVRNVKKEVYVDGGALNNYPIKLFDREKYLPPEEVAAMGLQRPYYVTQNKEFLKTHPASSPYTYNKQTLGFRLDSRDEIAAFRHDEIATHHIEKFTDYAKELLGTMMSIQNNTHLHSDDWQRTIYIDDKGISTMQFGLKGEQKDALVKSGRDNTLLYFDWYDKGGAEIFNRPESREPI
jgi:NTE family protein